MLPQEHQSQHQPTSAGQADRWAKEIAAAQKAVEKWHSQGEKAWKRFLDERERTSAEQETRWNLYYANVATQQALLFGRVPQVGVARRFQDAGDDVARKSADILQRLLNGQIDDEEDTYTDALHNALHDRLVPGMGVGRVRYEVETAEVPDTGREAVLAPDGAELAPAVPPEVRKVHEAALAEHVNWQDFLWSAGARTWKEVRWVAFKSLLSKEQAEKRFPKTAHALSYDNQSRKSNGYVEADDPWARAEVWEIWDKETRFVYWWSKGPGQLLDAKQDPLGLNGFFPCPRPMVANPTTRKYLPLPDLVLAQDQYNAIDEVVHRVDLLTKALAARGVYDGSQKHLHQLLSSASANTMIPVDNWAMFAEKGGLKGIVDWFPLDMVVNTIVSLESRLDRLQAQLYEITGMSDLLRGAATVAGVTATESGIKARFGSARLQAVQEDFARFASELARLRAEVICNRFDAERILEESNAAATMDADLVQQAVALLKSGMRQYKIKVRPEALSLADFSQQKGQRNEALMALAQFVQATAPVAQAIPGAQTSLLRLLQWYFAALPGAGEAEAILDQAIQQAQAAAAQPQQQAPPPPDPKLLQQQMKTQGDLLKIKAETEARQQELQAEVVADKQREANQAQANVAEAAAKAQISQAMKAQERAFIPGG